MLPVDPLLAKIGMRLPIIQAPMAGVSTPVMAAAVSNAGGLGSLGIGAVNAETARAMVAEFKRLSAGPLNANVFCHGPARPDERRSARWLEALRSTFAEFGAQPPVTLSEIYTSFVDDDAMLAMLLQERPRVVSFHFGLPPRERVEALRNAGIVLLATATNLHEARLIADAGIDGVVAQGYEAGGHRGIFDPAVDDAIGTFALVRLIVAELRTPVIAAGGIMDGAGIAAAMNLGAIAAQLGTAFIDCPESSADAGYRAALRSDAAHRTTVTRAISGRPARCLANRFTRLGESFEHGGQAPPQYPVAYDAGKALNAVAKSKGEYGFGAQWAGQGAPLCRSLPAEQLVRELAREAEACARGGVS